jgi:high-affinity nickel-transport protein
VSNGTLKEDKMLSLSAILLVGLLLGMRHATDPDHVVAVTTIVARQPGLRKAGLIGALWGIGHTCTIFVIGAIIILFRVTIPPRLGLSMEFAVAAMLVLLGILNLTGTLPHLQARFGSSSSSAGAATGYEVDRRNPTAPCDAAAFDASLGGMLRAMGAYTLFRPLIIGIVHGLAGSAAVALLVMATIHSSWWAISYLLIFGIGTIAGMVVITTLLAVPFKLTRLRFSGLNRGMTIASALLSVAFGLFLSVQIGFEEGLFSGHAHWIPR